MRAACDGCGAAQPADWKPGERCGACGRAVREDVRCFWCATWTPPGKFCRACGADVVDPALYGAARMLKEAGTDRFTVPKLLRDFDAERLEHFTRLYRRQQAVVLRHVDDLRFVERFLRRKDYAEALEEEWIPRLPLPDEAVKALELAPRAGGDDLSTLRAIQETTPIDETRRLAAVARVRLEDWTAVRDAEAALHDDRLATEAALALTGWRIRTAGLGKGRDPRVREILKAARKPEAAARLALDGDADTALVKEALASNDEETAFTAALAAGDVDRLRAALSSRDDRARLAAGRRLAELGVFAPLGPLLRSDLAGEMILALRNQKKPAPELRAALMALVEARHPEAERAAAVVARSCDGPTALRLVRATKGDHEVVRALLHPDAGLGKEAVGKIVAALVELGTFRKGQWGLDQAVEEGRAAPDLAPRLFGKADEAMRIELLGLAEKQLAREEDEKLRRFLLDVVFGPHPAKVRAAAAWVLRRSARRESHQKDAFPPLDGPSMARWYGPPKTFAPRLAALLRDDASLREVGLYDELASLLRSAGPALATKGLIDALLGVAGGNYSGFLGDAAIEALGRLAAGPPFRSDVAARLEALGKRGNYTLDRALRRLRLAEVGLPDENAWKGLPRTTAPSRFAKATPEGRRTLLELADRQLIDGPDKPLLAFLRKVAFGPYAPDLRIEAARIYADRSRDGWRYGEELAEGMASALREPALLGSNRFRRLLYELMEGCTDDPGLQKACLDVVEDPKAEMSLRRRALTFALGKGSKRLLPRLRKIMATGALGTDLQRIIEALDPEPPPKERPGKKAARTVPPVNVPKPPDPEVYAAKARKAERLGRELQKACLKISFGPLSPEAKTREIMRLQDEFRARIEALYR